NTYSFATKNNILYRVAFIVDETFSTISGEEIPNIFQLVVEKASETLAPFDPKVSLTIEDIVERFFVKTENALIYICSDENDKAEKRHVTFDRWYKKSKYREVIIKLDHVITILVSKTETQRLFTSFLFHKLNPNYERLI